MSLPRTLGRPEDIAKLTDFLNKSEHKDAINRKTTPATVLTWVNQLREAGIIENEQIINDQDAGRSSAPENDHPYLKSGFDAEISRADRGSGQDRKVQPCPRSLGRQSSTAET